MSKPHLWIIAGPNGAEKTTLVTSGPFAKALASCEFINPDALTLDHLKRAGVNAWKDAPADLLRACFIRAANDAQKVLVKRIDEGAAVAIESVLSTRKYCAVVERVLELKGKFMLIYMVLNSPQISRDRVRQRILEDGHGVPVEKLEPRWSKSLGLLPWFVARAHRFWILDNSQDFMSACERPLLSGSDSSVNLHNLPAPSIQPALSDAITEHATRKSAGRWRFNITALTAA